MPSPALTDAQILAVCQELLRHHRRVSVRLLKAHLVQRFGSGGRTKRRIELLKAAMKQMPLPESTSAELRELAELRRQLREAQDRAALSEERERYHQNYWAARYQEKLEELQGRAPPTPPSSIPAEKYLRLYQYAVELERRLSEYETVEPVARVLQTRKF